MKRNHIYSIGFIILFFMFYIGYGGLGLTDAQTAEFPDGLTGYDIAKLSNERYVAHDESTETWMILQNKRGDVRKRRLLRFRKNMADHKRVLMKFIDPDDIRDTGILNIEQPAEKYDTQFMYLPAVKKVRRMSGANKNNRWVGSDFFLEDIQEIKFNDWTYRRLADDEFEGFPCYVVEWLPKEDTDTIYSRQIYWYRKDGYLPVVIKYFDDQGKHWKTFSASDLKNNQGVWTAWIVRMEDHDTGHSTCIYRRWIFYDTDLPDAYFTTRTLEKRSSSYAEPKGLWDIVNSDGEYDDVVNSL